MIKRNLYIGYNESRIKILENKSVITASCAYYKDMALLYFESKNDLCPEKIAEGEMRRFPDGNNWFKTTEIFHYCSTENESLWNRKIKTKTPVFHINYLKDEKISSYIFYHYIHQMGNQYGCDRYLSIFLYQNMIIMYGEEPVEKILYEEIKDKLHIPCPTNWDELMDEHFEKKDNNQEGWIRI